MRRLGRQLTLFSSDGSFSFKRLLFGMVLFISLCASGLYFIKGDQILTALDAALVERGFAPQIIEITGRYQTDQAMLKTVLAPYQGMSIFSLDLYGLRAQLLEIGWVREAIVARKWPNRLEIKLKERRPIALLQTANGHKLIDDKGVQISEADPSEFSHLIVASGIGAAQQMRSILDILSTEPEILIDVWAVQRISDRRWDVHFRSGLIVKLPEKDALFAWSRLARLDQTTDIMRRDLVSIDLRFTDQLIVEPTTPPKAREQSPPAKTTPPKQARRT